MFSILLITFREGLEALLVVAIASLYLRRTGREQLLSAIRSGLGLAIVLSAILGYVLARIGSVSSVAQGVMALLASAAASKTTCATATSRRTGSPTASPTSSSAAAPSRAVRMTTRAVRFSCLTAMSRSRPAVAWSRPSA